MFLWHPSFFNIFKVGPFIYFFIMDFHDMSFLFHLNVFPSNKTSTSFSLDVDNIMVNSQFYVEFQTLCLLVKTSYLQSY